MSIHPTVAKAIAEFDAVIIGPGSFYTSLMPIFLVRGVAEALAQVKGPVILVANLLTEGRGMLGFTAADAVARIEQAIGRNVDVVIVNMAWPSPQVLGRYALEHKEPLAPGDLPAHCQLVGGEFWTGEIARHDRLRLAYAVWSVLSERLLRGTVTAITKPRRTRRSRRLLGVLYRCAFRVFVGLPFLRAFVMNRRCPCLTCGPP